MPYATGAEPDELWRAQTQRDVEALYQLIADLQVQLGATPGGDLNPGGGANASQQVPDNMVGAGGSSIATATATAFYSGDVYGLPTDVNTGASKALDISILATPPGTISGGGVTGGNSWVCSAAGTFHFIGRTTVSVSWSGGGTVDVTATLTLEVNGVVRATTTWEDYLIPTRGVRECLVVSICLPLVPGDIVALKMAPTGSMDGSFCRNYAALTYLGIAT